MVCREDVEGERRDERRDEKGIKDLDFKILIYQFDTNALI